MILEFTTEQKQVLLSEYSALNTISKRFEFWQKKLKTKYILFVLAGSVYNQNKESEESEKLFTTYYDFKIIPLSKEEILDYNIQLFQEYKYYVDCKRKVYDIEDMINT